MPPLPTQAQPQHARGRRPSGVCLLGQPRSRASHLPLGGCLDADKATADRGLGAPYLAQTYPDDHRHPRVGEDTGGQHPGHARRPALPEFTDRGSLHHELLWLPELLPVLRTSIVAVRPSDASNRLLGSRQYSYAAVASDSKITRPLNPQKQATPSFDDRSARSPALHGAAGARVSSALSSPLSSATRCELVLLPRSGSLRRPTAAAPTRIPYMWWDSPGHS